MATDRLVCSKCGREKPEKDFFKLKTGVRCDMCKVCLTMHINNREKDTFLWILEMFNVPYVEKKWVELSNKIYLKDDNCIYAEAGASLASLCCFARDNGLTGLEFAYGIPGSVGGALYMNAGAYGGDMSCVVASADSITVKGQKVSRCAEKLELGYRKSVFKKNGEIIIGVCFKLDKSSREEIGSKMDEIIAKRKKSQPLEYPSAGSTFKRPEGYYAAALIDECELKGRTVGGAKVSEKHAGFVINFDKATCEDVIGLVEVIKDTVKEKKGVDLETEIIFVGRQ